MNLKTNTRKILTAFISMLFLVVTVIILFLLGTLNESQYYIYIVALGCAFLFLIILIIIYWSRLQYRKENDVINLFEKEHIPEEKKSTFSNAQLEMAEEQAGLASWELDVETQKGKWSKQMFRFFNFEVSHEPPPFDEYLLRVHPDDRPLLLNDLHEGRNPEITVYRTNPGLIPLRYLMLTRTVIKNAHGKPAKLFGTLLDITEQQLAEKTIRESEEKYRTLIEQLTDAIFIINKQGQFDTVNSSACKLTQYSEEELLQMSIHDFTVKEDIEKNPFHFKALQKGETVVTERIMRCKNGDLINIEINAKMLSGERLLAFVRDISERVKVQNEIMREKNLSDSIINTLPGIFYLYTQQGKFIRWNKNFEVVSGYSAVEISSMHPLDFFVEQDKALLISKIENVFVNGEDSVEADFLTKSGKNIPYYFTGKAVEYQDEICLAGVGMDCTERRKTEEQIRLSEKKYRVLFHDNPMPLWIYCLKDLHFIDVNEAALTHYGYTREEFKSMSIKDIRPKEDIDYLSKEQQPSYRGIANVGVWRHIKKDGSIIKVEIITHDTYFEGEHVRIVLANDITDKYIAEEKLRKSLEAVRQLSSHQHLIREEERKRIGHEIHDELGQQLTAVKMDIAWIDKQIAGEDLVVKNKLKNVIALLNASNISIRRILSELRPAVLDDIGLLEAIEWLGNQFTVTTHIPVKFLTTETNITLPEEFAVCIYRVCQEAFTNITRYANAKNVSVSISTNQEMISVIIEDDGKGFNLKTLPKDVRSFGILGMKERVLALGGEFELISSASIGTKIRMVLPMSV